MKPTNIKRRRVLKAGMAAVTLASLSLAGCAGDKQTISSIELPVYPWVNNG
jgi:hypothetical protein